MQSKEISVWDLFGILNRHRTAFVLTLLVVIGLTICANVYLPRKYRSEAHLLVRLGRENLGLDSTLKLTEQPSVNVTQSREFELKTVANMVKQYSTVEKVVDEIGPAMILSADDGMVDRISDAIFDNEFMSNAFAPSYQMDERVNAIRELSNKCKVRVIPETHMIGIYYDNKDAQLAQRVVDAFVRNLLEHHAQTHRSKGSIDFIERERDQARTLLEKAEDDLKQFRTETGLVSVNEQRAAGVARISGLISQKLETDASISAIEKEVAGLEGALGDLEKVNVAEETSGAGNWAIDQMRADLYKLQLRDQELSAKYKPTNAVVVQIKKQIEEAKKILAEEELKTVQKTFSPSREYEETNILLIQKRSQRDAMVTKSQKLEQLITTEELALDQLDGFAVSVNRMQREIDLLAENYNRFAREAELTRVDNSLGKTNLSNLSVEQQATLDRYPVFPNVPLNLSIGIVLSLFLGGLVCVVLETWSSRSRTGAPETEIVTHRNGVHRPSANEGHSVNGQSHAEPSTNESDQLEENEQELESQPTGGRRFPR
jgi:polysaccharide biosynthesis protein PslE